MDTAMEKRNDALRLNPNEFRYPTSSDINITVRGSDWYWAVTAIMAASTVAFIALSYRVPRRNRVFHYITASITLVATIAYFTMASNLGYTPILVEFRRSNPRVSGLYREIFYVRYIDWFITTPLLLLDLMLTAGLPWPTILYTLLLDEVMIVTGLVGALVSSRYKWGYFVFAMVALMVIAWNVVQVGRKHAAVIGPNVHKVYMMCGAWTIFLWFIYPIAWGLSEGGNVISPDGEAVFYGILDILAKPVFGALLLWGHRNIDPAVLGLHIRDYDDTINHGEKNSGIGSSAAHANAGVAPGSTGVLGHNGVGHNGVSPTGTTGTGHNGVGYNGVTGQNNVGHSTGVDQMTTAHHHNGIAGQQPGTTAV